MDESKRPGLTAEQRERVSSELVESQKRAEAKKRRYSKQRFVKARNYWDGFAMGCAHARFLLEVGRG